MASWLASQLKAAETLLEAVDRTVSTATAAAGQATRPLGSGGQSTAAEDVNVIHQHTKGPFSSSQAAAPQQTVSRVSLDTPSPLAPAHGVPLPPAQATTAVSGPPPPMFQQRPWQPGSSAVGQGLVNSPPAAAAPFAYGLPQATDPIALPHPSSTGSYTVRQHGPFSASTVDQQLPQQVPAQPLAVASSSLTVTIPATVPALATAHLDSQRAADLLTVHSSSTGSTPPVAPHSRLDQLSATALGSTNSSGADLAGSPGGSGEPDVNAAVATAADKQQALQEEYSNNSPALPAAAVLQSSTEPQHTGGSAALNGALLPAAAVTLCTTEAAATDGSLTSSTDAAEAVASVTAGADTPAAQQQPQVSASMPAMAAISAAIGAAIAETKQQHHIPGPVQLKQQQQSSAQPTPASGSFGPPPPAAILAAAAAAPLSAQSLVADEDAFSGGVAISASGGASAKEAQLTRLVETLRKRLDRTKAENEQLEDLLHSAEQRTAAEQQRAEQMAAEVAAMHKAQDDLITSAAANAAAQDARIGRLQQDLEASNRQVTALQDALEAIQEQHQQVLSSKDSIEGGALEALRSELSKAEAQLEAERKEHASTKAAATARERDLEEQLSSSSQALAATQRQFQELASRSRDLEEQHALAVAEAARAQQQLRQLEGQQVAAQRPDPVLQQHLEAERESLGVQLAEVQAALLAANQAQRAAEAQVANLQHELVQLQNSIQASAARGPPQLEQQVSELQELLYQKQQQLERLSGEKQGQVMMLERQVHMLRQELGKAHAAAAAASTTSSGRVAHDIIPMDALGEPYQRLARHRKLGGAVQATANFLDTTAATATQLLRQQPLARLVVFVYLILIHLYVYFLLARMQRQAVMLLTAQDKSAGSLGAQMQEPGPGSLPH